MIETQSLKDTKEISENPLSYKIIGAAIEVHRTLGGPGLLEGVYQSALIIDILVEDRVIVEVKATEKDHPIHDVQLLTYLPLTGLRLGLVINFGSKQVKGGIKRVINGCSL